VVVRADEGRALWREDRDGCRRGGRGGRVVYRQRDNEHASKLLVILVLEDGDELVVDVGVVLVDRLGIALGFHDSFLLC